MILAAGQGTRLLPLTKNRPKPLFPVLNRPLLDITLTYLSRFSLERVFLNTHHLASQIEDFVQIQKANSPFKIKTTFEPQILGTGGGIGQTRNFWKSDLFLVINGDIITDIDLQQAMDFHRSHHGLVTLILHDYPEFNQISVNGRGRVKNFRQERGQGLAFTGIHILDRAIFDFLPSSGNYEIIPIYQKMIQKGLPIWAYVSQGHYWRDIGTPQSYLKVHEECLSTPTPPLLHLREREEDLLMPTNRLLAPPRRSGDTVTRRPENKGIFVHPEATIEKDVVFSGWACIGKGCLLKKGCRIQNSVLWEDVVVETDLSVFESIVGQGGHVQKNNQGGLLI